MTTTAEKLTTINGSLGDIKTAIEGKGVTPSGDITTYATAIGSISGGSGINLPREISSQGVYQMPTSSFIFTLPSDATNLGNYALAYAFYGSTGITGADLSSLTAVSGRTALGDAFDGCTNLTYLDLSSLVTISGISACTRMCNGCSNLTSVNLSSLESIVGSSWANAFTSCTSLASITFTKLNNVATSQVMRECFSLCTSLASISFPALTTSSFGSFTNVFTDLLKNSGTNVVHTIHFPSNLESTIQGLIGYPLFGGTQDYVELAFDLAATS